MNAMETAAYCLAYRLAIAKETEEGKITDRLKEIRHRDQIGIPKKIFETSISYNRSRISHIHSTR